MVGTPCTRSCSAIPAIDARNNTENKWHTAAQLGVSTSLPRIVVPEMIGNPHGKIYKTPGI